jgi:hypothetical protein
MAARNLHHSLLQLLFSRPFLTRDELALLRPYQLDVQPFVQGSNRLLLPLGLELRMAISDHTDVEYYGICPIFEDATASECLGLKAEIVQLFFKFLDLLINLDDRTTSAIPIGVLLDSAEGMQASDAQAGIHKLRDLGYFEIREEKIRIGPRGLLEFRPTFTNLGTGENACLQQCPVCLDFVLAGLRCPQCECYCHRRCAESINGRCPVCACQQPFVEFGM